MSSRGFSVMEVVIYIALLSILMSGGMVAAYELLQGGERNLTAASVQEEGTFLIRKINWALTSASAASASPDGQTLTITKLSGPDFLATDNPIVITNSGGQITLSRGGGAGQVLTSAGISVTNFSARVSGTPSHVMVGFIIGTTPFVLTTFLRQ